MGEQDRDKTEIEQFKPCIEASERVAGGVVSHHCTPRAGCHRRRLFGELSAGKADVVQQYGKLRQVLLR